MKMLEGLTGILLLCMLLFGFVVMRHLDHALDFMSETSEIECVKEKSILVFGSESDPDKWLHSTLQAMSSNGMAYQQTTDPDLPFLKRFSLVLALSDNDLDNLLLCNKARHLDPCVFTVARCSGYIYKTIFAQQGIDRIVTEKLPAAALLNILKLG